MLSSANASCSSSGPPLAGFWRAVSPTARPQQRSARTEEAGPSTHGDRHPRPVPPSGPDLLPLRRINGPPRPLVPPRRLPRLPPQTLVLVRRRGARGGGGPSAAASRAGDARAGGEGGPGRVRRAGGDVDVHGARRDAARDQGPVRAGSAERQGPGSEGRGADGRGAGDAGVRARARGRLPRLRLRARGGPDARRGSS